MQNQPPPIAVHFNADGDVLSSVSLSLAPQFSFVILHASANLTAALTTWIENYLQKKEPSIQHSLWEHMTLIPFSTPFQQTIWKQMSLIPFGSTLSYGQLATLSGNPKAHRAVGSACNKNHYPLLIPCHRVIHAGKKIGGFAFDLEIKKRLLKFESGGSPAQTLRLL